MKFVLPDKVYDVLVFVAQVVLPAIGTLYFALAGIWGFPYGEEIVGTITAVDAFLGGLLGLSSVNYNKTAKKESEISEMSEQEKWLEGK